MNIKHIVLKLTVLSLPLFCAESVLAAFVQWPVESSGNGNFYQAILHPDGITWDDAKAEAESLGGHLATVTSA